MFAPITFFVLTIVAHDKEFNIDIYYNNYRNMPATQYAIAKWSEI